MFDEKKPGMSKALFKFKRRLDYFYDDVDLVDVIDAKIKNGEINNLLEGLGRKHDHLNRRKKEQNTLKNLVGHLKQTVYAGTVKDMYEEVTTYFKTILSQAAENGYNPDRIIGEHKCNIDAKIIFSSKTYEEIVKFASDDIFKKLESERSTIKLIRKFSDKLGLDIDSQLIERTIPFLELRHLLVHNDSILTDNLIEYENKYQIKFPTRKKKEGRKIQLNYSFMIELRERVEKLIFEIDAAVLKNNLIKKEDIEKSNS